MLIDFIYSRTKDGKELKQMTDYVHSVSSNVIEERRQAIVSISQPV